MSYTALGEVTELGEITTRLDAETGEHVIYSLRKDVSEFCPADYLITLRTEGKEDETLILSLWEEEARKLAELISNN